MSEQSADANDRIVEFVKDLYQFVLVVAFVLIWSFLRWADKELDKRPRVRTAVQIIYVVLGFVAFFWVVSLW